MLLILLSQKNLVDSKVAGICYFVDSLFWWIDEMTQIGAGMDGRFEAYVEALSGVLGHSDRTRPLHSEALPVLRAFRVFRP